MMLKIFYDDQNCHHNSKNYLKFFQIYGGKNRPVLRDIDNKNLKFINRIALKTEIHKWCKYHKIDYNIYVRYVIDIHGYASKIIYYIDIPDDKAILFKLTWI